MFTVAFIHKVKYQMNIFSGRVFKVVFTLLKWIPWKFHKISPVVSLKWEPFNSCQALRHVSLTHSGRVTHICVSKLTIIGSDNGLSPRWHQAIIWTNAAILSIRPKGTYFSEILIWNSEVFIQELALKCLIMAAILSRPQCVKACIINYISYFNWDAIAPPSYEFNYGLDKPQSKLTHPPPLDKKATISQTTFSNAFSWMKMLEFQFKFHWKLFLCVQLTIRIGDKSLPEPMLTQCTDAYMRR